MRRKDHRGELASVADDRGLVNVDLGTDTLPVYAHAGGESFQAVEDGYSVGLFSNSCLAHADQPFRIPPGRSR